MIFGRFLWPEQSGLVENKLVDAIGKKWNPCRELLRQSVVTQRCVVCGVHLWRNAQSEGWWHAVFLQGRSSQADGKWVRSVENMIVATKSCIETNTIEQSDCIWEMCSIKQESWNVLALFLFRLKKVLSLAAQTCECRPLGRSGSRICSKNLFRSCWCKWCAPGSYRQILPHANGHPRANRNWRFFLVLPCVGHMGNVSKATCWKGVNECTKAVFFARFCFGDNYLVSKFGVKTYRDEPNAKRKFCGS